MGPKNIAVDPDAWATKDMCIGPTLGKIHYDKMPIQSLNPLRYTHEKLYSEKTVIGLMKAAYYDGYTEREKEAREAPNKIIEELEPNGESPSRMEGST